MPDDMSNRREYLRSGVENRQNSKLKNGTVFSGFQKNEYSEKRQNWTNKNRKTGRIGNVKMDIQPKMEKCLFLQLGIIKLSKLKKTKNE